LKEVTSRYKTTYSVYIARLTKQKDLAPEFQYRLHGR